MENCYPFKAENKAKGTRRILRKDVYLCSQRHRRQGRTHWSTSDSEENGDVTKYKFEKLLDWLTYSERKT